MEAGQDYREAPDLTAIVTIQLPWGIAKIGGMKGLLTPK
jgi:hypothetical protein